MKKKKNSGQIILNLVFIAIIVLYIVPVLTLISCAFTDETALIQNGFGIIPSAFSTEAFTMVLRNSRQLINSYIVTIFVTVVSTISSVLLMSLLAYPMARPNFVWGKALNFLVLFTMLFNGGMVPTYLLFSNVLHVTNSVWALIVGGLVSGYHVMVIRTSYYSVPYDLVEAAKIDGAKELYICFKILIPLSKASIASVAFLFMVARWNTWDSSMLYVQKKPDLYMLQYLLQRMIREVEMIKQLADPSMLTAGETIPSETMRFAMALLAAGPVLVIFPFFQKYFTKGMNIGGVKG